MDCQCGSVISEGESGGGGSNWGLVKGRVRGTGWWMGREGSIGMEDWKGERGRTVLEAIVNAGGSMGLRNMYIEREKKRYDSHWV